MVNTATAATQMSRERTRPYRALCTPGKGEGALRGCRARSLWPPAPGLDIAGVHRWAATASGATVGHVSFVQ